MALWTDIIDPATLTGYTRAYMEEYEASKGSLARWLPNRFVQDITVRFVKGDNGLIPIADFRAYDAEPTIGGLPEGERVTIELPAVGRKIPVSEYNQLRSRSANPSDEAVLGSIQKAAKAVARSAVDAVERLRGTVLQTGKATVTGFMDDSFGRSAGNSETAAVSWGTSTTDALAEAQTWIDYYTDLNGEAPGATLVSTRVLRAIAGLDQFATALVGGGSRPATMADAQATWQAAGLPPIYTYDRRVNIAGTATKVLSDDRLFFLPAPTDPNDEDGSPMGATHWGRTLSSGEPDWDIGDAEQPGLVVGVFRNEQPPMIAEVISDAIALPTLANPDLSFVADVIA
jgi:hypothetical protein